MYRFLRSLRVLLLATITILLGIALTTSWGSREPILQLDGLSHYLDDSSLLSSQPLQPSSQQSLQQVAQTCKDNGFKPFDAIQSRPRRVYDLFLLWQELDWLEIRLNTLSPYVDYFVIVEEAKTFTGLSKPLYLKENWDRFSAFHSKIIYKVVEDPFISTGSAWDHETFMRNAMLDKVFPGLDDNQSAIYGDILLVSDIDEIPKPDVLSVLRICDFPARLTLRSHFYYYSFQWLHCGAEWAHPQATTYQGVDTIPPQELRMGRGSLFSFIQRYRESANLWHAAWHCSSCFATVEQMQDKMASFSHKEYNTAQNRQPSAIIERVRNGLDLFGRKGQVYNRVEDNQDVPSWLMQNRDKYEYMLNRDGANAGFVDWPPTIDK